jgi:hypothetical protein
MYKNSGKSLVVGFCLLAFARQLGAQEEFFGNKYGLSLGYSHGNSVGINDISISAYLKKVIIEAGLEYSPRGTAPMVALIICPGFSDSASYVKSFLALEYGVSEGIKVAGIGIGMMVCLFRKSDFPCSLGISGSGVFTLNKPLPGEVIPAVSLAYTQAFFPKSPVYPVLGISNSFYIVNHTQVFFFHAGLNIRFG